MLDINLIRVVEKHIEDGYEFVLPPHILVYECGYTAGQFPKFADDVFHLQEQSKGRAQFLLPTAETVRISAKLSTCFARK
jgi:seryl-tRNA synthetase